MALYIHETCVGCGACLRICPVDAVSGKQKKQHEIDRYRCIECSACGRVCPTGSITDIFGEVIEKLPRTAWDMPKIDREACTACGICAEVCPTGAMEMEKQGDVRFAAVRHPSSCISCEWCYDNCMFSAIEMKERDADPAKGRGEKLSD